MIVIEVPVSSYSLSNVVLNGQAFQIRYDYNLDGDYWTFGIKKNEEYVWSGIKIVPGIILNPRGYFPDAPEGVFLADTSLDRIGANDFAESKARFCFVSSGENLDDIMR